VTSSNWSALANPIVLSGTKTNWDDALERAKNVAPPNPAGPNPPLVLFLTDGDPNASNNTSGAEVDNTGAPVTAATEAVQWINAIRAAGSPIIAIGFGQVASAGYLDAAFTGNSSDPTNINFETSSVIKMDSVNSLPGVMATLGNQMCGTLSLNKRTSSFSHSVTTSTPSFHVIDDIPFTLDLTNNAMTPVSGVVVQDQVPSVLTPVTVTASSSATSFTQTPAVVGNLITWSIPMLPARTTVTLSFKGKFDKVMTAPASETYPNYAQVTAALNYTATALGNMNPVTGPAVEVDESAASFTETVYVPVDQCAATPKPVFCYVQVSKVPNNPESCLSSPAGGPVNTCLYTISVNLNSTNIPAGSTVTIADTFTVGGTPVSPPLASPNFPTGLCASGAPTTIPFTCNHGSLTSFFGVVTAMIPAGLTGQLKNCMTVTVANMSGVTPPTVMAPACAPP
jgi:uncharacterized repeat protein (TIGR01451 family)